MSIKAVNRSGGWRVFRIPSRWPPPGYLGRSSPRHRVNIMCRYAMHGPYKSHYACFDCRKAFKQAPMRDWLALHGLEYAYDELSRIWAHKPSLQRREVELGVRYGELMVKYQDAAHRCPECREPMIDMGLDFKPPKQQDKKAWRILQGMYRVGHAFQTCGCNGPGWVPKSQSDYKHYLEERRASYSAQLSRVQLDEDCSTQDKNEAGNHWSELIVQVEAELRSIA